MAVRLSVEVKIKKQPSEAFWSTFTDLTSEKWKMMASYPDQAQFQFVVIGC